MPTSVAHQSFWDRVPNASTTAQLLSRRENRHRHSTKHKQRELHQYAPLRDLSLQQQQQQARVSKRKQSHPMRSPQAIANGGAQNDSTGKSATQLSAAKARRVLLDGHLPQLLRAEDKEGKGGGGENDGIAPSRAFRLSFSDDYLRNPQEYVQALIDSESLVATPMHKVHSSASRSRRSTQGGS
ncbi:hypothetical protein EV175_006886, partial [Coemansia sp. RSA 1933]